MRTTLSLSRSRINGKIETILLNAANENSWKIHEFCCSINKISVNTLTFIFSFYVHSNEKSTVKLNSMGRSRVYNWICALKMSSQEKLCKVSLSVCVCVRVCVNVFAGRKFM